MSTYGMREGGNAGEWITDVVTRNPEGLLLLGAGIALLMRSGRGQSAKYRYAQSMSQRERQYSRTQEPVGEGVGERVGEVARRAGEYVSGAKEQVAETARSYTSAAAEYADEASQAAMERSRRMADQVRETADYLVREQPWAVALAGVLAGAAVAAVFPSTRIERRTLGDVGDRLRSAAGAAGEQVMEAGMKASERLNEIAEERGLTSEGLKQAAQDVGETFSSALSSEEELSVRGNYGQKPGERARSSPQNRPTQGATTKQSTHPQSGGPQSRKDTRPGGTSTSATPSGGRR
jgi:Sec-independent protein translocase protein TatA